jgi:hypothetical protein
MPTPVYEVRHELSRFCGRMVRCIIRPSPKRQPNNVLVEDIWTGEQWSCPWRGLRRVKDIAIYMTQATG